jgi:hypothetical protein
MPGDHLLNIPNTGQVECPVPFVEQLQQTLEVRKLVNGRRHRQLVQAILQSFS